MPIETTDSATGAEKGPASEAHSSEEQAPTHKSRRAWAWQFFTGLVGFLVVVVALTKTLREPLELAGAYMVQELGVVGLCSSVLFVDAIPTPLSFVPLMLLAAQGGMPLSLVYWTCAAASICAGMVGYFIGRVIGMPEWLDRFITRRHPGGKDWLKRYGAVGVVIVGILPLPFAIGTWTAGAMKVPAHQVALACLIRIPKTAIYFGLIVSGLQIGGAL
ncbi:MAG: VTT domain-containing protein [Myxococcota bacterium]|nr:VTT domain-containing protein [Myxococcota bacterium]